MKFFSNFFSPKHIAIDLGTANTLIVYNDELIINEPSIIAIDRHNPKKVIAVGKNALKMHEKTHENIVTIRPLKDGVIADFYATEVMIREFIRKLFVLKKISSLSSLKMMICVPSDITQVESKAVVDSAEQAGAKEVFLIPEPMAAALGIGLNIDIPEGNMIVDIGGGTTGISIIAMMGIVKDQSIRIAGDEFNQNIIETIRRNNGLLIGERTAERIKMQIGVVDKNISDPPDDMPVNGRDLVTGVPKQIHVSYKEIADSLDKSLIQIEEAIVKALEQSPPELASDIYSKGIYLSGGGALLRGIDQRISKLLKVPVHISSDPLFNVVNGTNLAIKRNKSLPFIVS